MKNYSVDSINRFPIYYWDKEIIIDDKTREQLSQVASLPFIFKHLAIMPDAHYGQGASIGSVIATKGVIMPYAVGVDIGCGVLAYQTNLKLENIYGRLEDLKESIEMLVPIGRTNNGYDGDKGSFPKNKIPDRVENLWNNHLKKEYEDILFYHPEAKAHNTSNHLGTLGTGNHFIELNVDKNESVWILIHSGSRGAGNKFGMYFSEKAEQETKRDLKKYSINNKYLSYLAKDSKIFKHYIKAVNWSVLFAKISRESMLVDISNALEKVTNYPCNLKIEGDNPITTIHNYVTMENHFSTNVYITRKGAIEAKDGQYCVIPGTMGTSSYIVKGKGNRISFNSAAHGAGRTMSRKQAKKEITLNVHEKAMHGIVSRKDKSILDESPSAYKDINAVMSSQDDLVSIVHELKPILNIKG